MLHPSTQRLLDRLAEMTVQRKIKWIETSSGIAYEAEKYFVVLTNDPQNLQLTDKNAVVLEDVSADALAQTSNEAGRTYNALFDDMYAEGARQARGTESAIDDVLAGLDLDGDGIPDIPAPAPAVSHLPKTASQVPADYEDVADESGAPITAAADTVDEAPEEFAETPPLDESESEVSSAVETLANEVNSGQQTPQASPFSSGFGAAGLGAAGLGATLASTDTAPEDSTAEPVVEEPVATPGWSNETADTPPADEPMIEAAPAEPVAETSFITAPAPAPAETYEPAPHIEEPASPFQAAAPFEAASEPEVEFTEPPVATPYEAPETVEAEASPTWQPAPDTTPEPIVEPEPAEPFSLSDNGYNTAPADTFTKPEPAPFEATTFTEPAAETDFPQAEDTAPSGLEPEDTSVPAFGVQSEEVADTAADTFSEVTETVAETAAHTYEAASDTLSGYGETAETAFDSGTEAISEAVEDSTHLVIDATEDVIAETPQFGSPESDVPATESRGFGRDFAAFGDQAADTVQAGTEAISDTLETAVDAVTETASDTVDTASDWAASAGEAASEAASEIGDTAAGITSSVTSGVFGATAQLRNAAESAVEDATQVADKLVESAEPEDPPAETRSKPVTRFNPWN